MRTNKKILFLILVSFLLLPCLFGIHVNVSFAKFSDAYEATSAASSASSEADQTAARHCQENLAIAVQGGHEISRFSSVSSSTSFTRHIMCKDHDLQYNPIDPTIIFRPSDTKAECLTTVSINDTIEFKWYYRSNSSRDWVPCYNWSTHAPTIGEYHYVGYLLIAGYWPGANYPRAYKVDVYLDGAISFSEFFEITNGGLNSPRTCENIDASEHPVNMKSRFTINVDTRAYHYLRFDNIAYFNEELGCSHNFTTIWIQPDGTTYKMHSGRFTDYKDDNVTWNCWKFGHTIDDYISINSSTPVGNWKVEVYLDSFYFNNTWVRYGPIATTPFIVGSEPVADWTFMVYLDADNTLENASIEIFSKMASVGSSSQVNIVAQMDRTPDQDSRYGNWTDCKRFYVTKDMTPTPGNATLDLGEVNMGHPDTLKDFVNWTIYYYPANYYFLVLWDHGTGCMGVCFDATSANDALSLPELSQALNGLPAIIDAVLIDACSMSMIEIAYQIKDYANVLVGPEGLGYGPPPYDQYLLGLTHNSSMSPSTFASEVVTDYMNWCAPIEQIKNATMSATDLTKITSLMVAIEDFVLKLKEKETLYYEQIELARNLTEGYEGPYAGDSGCYVDLYHFAQLLTYQSVSDEELRNTANQVITVLSIGNTIIKEAHKVLQHSHGLSIFFPNEKKKYYDSYGSVYEKTSFAIDTGWDKFLKYYLSGCFLTIDTHCRQISVKVDEESYTTDNDGNLKLFVLPGLHAISVPTSVLTEPSGSRGVFTQWKDGSKSNPRTILMSGKFTLEAEYETQYYLTVNTDPSDLTPQPTIFPLGPWYAYSTRVTCTTQEISGYVFDHWTVDGTSRDPLAKNITVIMNEPHEATAHYVHARSWLENLLTTTDMKIILALVGLAITGASIGTAWVRTRRRRGIVNALLNKIDEVYSRFKTDPLKCEEELCRLRNTIFEGVTDSKITEASHNIVDKRILKYIEELRIQTHAREPEPVKIPTSEFLPGRITTGYGDLDNLLFGGLPKNYAVILTSPSCDERDALIRRFLETGAEKGETTFYITIDPADARELAEKFQTNFYLFVCNPRADVIIKNAPNIIKLKGVENLTDVNIAMFSAFRELDKLPEGPRRACIEIISDVLLQHDIVQTRRWLSALIPEFKSKDFTTLAVMDPGMHSPQAVRAVLDLFEGEINIYDKAPEMYLKIKRMHNQRYLDSELPLSRKKLLS